MRRKIFHLSFLLFLLSIIGIICYFVSLHIEEDRYIQLGKSRHEVSDLEDEKGTDIGLGYYLIDGVVVQEELKDLYLENSDIVGWIYIEDTLIDYPVLCSKEKGFYLYRDFYCEYSLGGSIFTEYGNDCIRPDENILIYGHHMADGSMFGELTEYEDEEFYNNHRYITFDTLRGKGKYEVIASFRTKIYPDSYNGFKYYEYTGMDKETFESFMDNIKDLSIYEVSSAVYGDNLITLSTCAYHDINGRFVVVAKRVDGIDVDLEKEPIDVIEKNEEKHP